MGILRLSVLYLLFLLILPVSAYAQLSSGGFPPGFSINFDSRNVTSINLKAPDYAKLRKEDDSLSAYGVPERMGVSLPVSISDENATTIISLNKHESLLQISLKVDDAVGLGLYFSDFLLGPLDKLFVYSADRSHVIGAFTHLNNRFNRLFATEVVKGASVVIELVENTSDDQASSFVISEVLVAYKEMEFPENGLSLPGNEPAIPNFDDRLAMKNAGNSGECEVNTSCVEGDAWRDQINGIVRIMIKNGPSSYWCTGSIMNNTRLDFTPYILTADHCAANLGVYATAEDLAKWVFYFNHEARACDDDRLLTTRSLTGAERIASSSIKLNDGSDFYLVKLYDIIPNTYSPFYLGWSARDELSSSGVSIHHPNGDVKKISTYTTPLQITQWGQVSGTHFNVRWAETANGHGVTEGGSSGSPLLNADGLVIGQLTGGESSCTNVNGPDQYGRLFFSWDQNGTSPDTRLQPWLDPENTGLKSLEGSFNTRIAIGQFTASETVIPVGTSTSFADLSRNDPWYWLWNFEGGAPSESTMQNPEGIQYNQTGTFNVSLIVRNDFGVDTVVYRDYIRVVPVVYPNPVSDKINIMFGNEAPEAQITIISTLGKVVAEILKPADLPVYEYHFGNTAAGMYFIRVAILSTGKDSYYKIIYTP